MIGPAIRRSGNAGIEVKPGGLMRSFVLLLAAMLVMLCLAGCAGGAGDPVETVQDYLQAKVDGDAETLGRLLCSEMEAVLERETHTFDSVSDVQIEDMSCTFDGSSAVSCDGRIVALYGTEETEFQLTNYRVVQEDGEWKWCGESGP
jgi:hypothetical protein